MKQPAGIVRGARYFGEDITKMAGQIVSRGKKKWLVRVFIGRDDQGKRQYHNQTVHGNKEDAQNVLTNLLRDRSTGVLAITAERRDVGTLLDDLLTDYKMNGKDYDWARLLVEKQLRPAFGALSIAKFGTAHVNRFIEQRRPARLRRLSTTNWRYCGGLSSSGLNANLRRLRGCRRFEFLRLTMSGADSSSMPSI